MNPQTWLVKGLVSTALHDVPVHCADNEWVTFQPPSGSMLGSGFRALMGPLRIRRRGRIVGIVGIKLAMSFWRL